MVAEFSAIKPRLKTVLESITLDGNSGRTVNVPVDFPAVLEAARLPTIINVLGITRDRNATDLRNFRNYIITVTGTLYLVEAGQGLNISNEYDIYSYIDKIDDIFTSKSHLEDANNAPLDGVSGHVILERIPQAPVIRPYPVNVPNAQQYYALEFTLSFPFRKVKDC